MKHALRTLFTLCLVGGFWPIDGLPGRQCLGQINIVIDYSFDANNFFGSAGSDQRIAIETAASMLSSRLGDSLTAITPGGGSTWSATFFNPATGLGDSVFNPTIAANEIRIYAGGRVLGGSTLGQAGPGGFSSTGGTTPFFDNIFSRGESGITDGSANELTTQTDFAPWGGSATFDTNATWNFSLSNPTAGQNDFLSVALHEIGHVLGIGSANSWDNQIVGGEFTGIMSTALNGEFVDIDPGLGHWLNGTTGFVNGVTLQEAAMDPSITVGTRKLFTELDFAALADIGWEVTPVPEPGTWVLLAGLAVGGWAVRRKRSLGRETNAAETAKA